MKKKKYEPSLIFSLIALLLIIISFFFYLKTPNSENYWTFFWNLTGDIGIVVITVVIIGILWNSLGGNPVENSLQKLDMTLEDFRESVQLLEDSKKTGLLRSLAVSGEFGSHSDWMTRLKSAEETINLLGYTLLVWSRGENFENEVINLVKKGVKIRVLAMDEENPELSSMINTRQIKATSMETVIANIKAVKSVFNSILERLENVETTGSLEFRTLVNGLILCQICRTDNELTMVQYLHSQIGTTSPIILVKGIDSTLFKVYDNEFEKLWELSQMTP